MEKQIKLKIYTPYQSIFLQKMLKKTLNISFRMSKNKDYAYENTPYLFIYFDKKEMTHSNSTEVFETNSNTEVTFEELTDYLNVLDDKTVEKEFKHLLLEAQKRYPMGTTFETVPKESKDTYIIKGSTFKECRNALYPKYSAIYEESSYGLVWTKKDGWAEIIGNKEISKKMTKIKPKFKIGQYVDIIKKISINFNSYFFKNGFTNLKILNIDEHFGEEALYLLADGEGNSLWVRECDIKLSYSVTTYHKKEKKLKVNSIPLKNLNILDY